MTYRANQKWSKTMNTASEQHSLAEAIPRPPILEVPFDPYVTNAQDELSFDLKSYWHLLYHSRWLISWITAIITLIAVVYVLVAKPVFEANLMIHVEEESSNASKNILSEASSLFETKKNAIAEIELLRSRMVVSRALDNLQLFIDVQPKYLPVVGSWLSKYSGNSISNPGLFGYGGYVWGAERAKVSLFEVPDALLGRKFTLTSLANERFRLTSAGQRILLDGAVGTRYRVQIPGGEIALKVDHLIANPGASFTLRRFSHLSMTQEIQNALVITERGKDSGIIEVKLRGENAQDTYRLLSEISREYMRQNLARKTEEAEKSLAFVNQQLPNLKRQLEQAEDQYSRFRNAHSAVDLQEEARISLEQAAAARARRIELIKKKVELLARFTENHPVLEAINREQQEVDAEIAAINARMKAMPMLEKDESRLMREIKVNTDLYTALSNTAQQLRLSAVGRVSNVRMIDAPMRPESPVKPKGSLIVALAGVTGLFLGVLAAFMRKAIMGGIDAPQQIERLLRARVVYATIPHSSRQEKLMRKTKDCSLPLLATVMPEDPAVESLRSFRAALQFSMPHFKNNIIMFAGPTRGIGKSFVTSNFAAVVAASGKRVLLIDADLRNGQLCRYFSVDHTPGLSSAILGKADIAKVIHHNVLNNLDFIATGEVPANCSEFLLHPKFEHLLKQTSAHYDLILIDSPPLLTGAEAVIIGAHAGAVFMVAHSGRTSEAQINESINHLMQVGIPLQGVLLNGTPPRLGAYTYDERPGINRRKITYCNTDEATSSSRLHV
jgi:tyrosine-protein kinase Etk/Wzc